ncbi:hypothetical protein [Joostella sp.]|uniref:hypothetical protein n=1 Tax=Joostella sp. TaxID=2231138 RepID=UPI003A8DEF27
MTIERALQVLEQHNEWRRDKNVTSEMKMVNPTELGNAIDVTIEYIKNNNQK